MNWFKKKRQDTVSPEAVGLFLLKKSVAYVNDTSQTLGKHLNATEHFKLPKVENELLYFFVFSLDYWIQTGSSRTKEEQSILRQALFTHLVNSGVNFTAVQQRFQVYGKIVNETKGDDKFMGFGMKLGEICGISNALFLIVAPELFTKALEFIQILDSMPLKLR